MGGDARSANMTERPCIEIEPIDVVGADLRSAKMIERGVLPSDDTSFCEHARRRLRSSNRSDVTVVCNRLIRRLRSFQGLALRTNPGGSYGLMSLSGSSNLNVNGSHPQQSRLRQLGHRRSAARRFQAKPVRQNHPAICTAAPPGVRADGL